MFIMFLFYIFLELDSKKMQIFESSYMRTKFVLIFARGIRKLKGKRIIYFIWGVLKSVLMYPGHQTQKRSNGTTVRNWRELISKEI
jgi:hypothetical protein